MSRTKALKGTVLVAAGAAGLALAMERWPNGTIIGLSLAAIYAKLREVPDDRPA